MGKKQSSNGHKNGNDYRINEEIRIPDYVKVRICGDGIESRVVNMAEARKIAADMEMDLIDMDAKGDAPIMKIGNYSKMMYNLKKSQKKQKQTQLKEIQLSVNIAKNDMETKARKASEFISEGDKVKVSLRMRGRELARREENKRCIYEFITMLEDIAVPESMPKDEGNRTTVILKKKK